MDGDGDGMRIVLLPRTTESKFESRHEPHEPQTQPIQPIVDGSKLWAELHTQQSPTQEWFDGWLSRVPNFGCSCRKDFLEYLKTNPPRFDDFYAWSVEAHNYVNQKTGKPIWDIDSQTRIA
jgi:hypothetical protein